MESGDDGYMIDLSCLPPALGIALTMHSNPIADAGLDIG